MIVYQTPTVTLDYNSLKHQLVQTWKGFSSSETFRTAIDKTVSFTKTNHVDTILSDTLEQAVVKPEDSAYAASVMPQLFASGVKAMAFVMPKNVLTQMSLKKFGDESKTPSNVQFFSSVAEAQKWLSDVSAAKEKSAM
jgi:hypothetical protein